MEDDQIQAELESQRAKLQRKLDETTKRVSESFAALQSAILTFQSEEKEAQARATFVPSALRTKQREDIESATQGLTAALTAYYEAEEELQAQLPTR
jgi:monomeric isocitrate dehydrogenase